MPCEVDITGYSAMIPVWSERIYSIQSALKCARRELKLYIFTFMHLADAFIQSDLQLHSGYTSCVPWESNPQPFALLTQCSTTEPHRNTEVYDVTLVCAWRRCAAQMNEWMDFPCSGSREQWTLCREHVNQNTVHAWSALLTSWLSEYGGEDWNREPLL